MTRIKNGSRSGYAEYRYGETHGRTPRLATVSIQKGSRVVQPQVSAARLVRGNVSEKDIAPRLSDPVRLHQPAFTEKQLPEIIKIVADLLRDADASPWGNESAVLDGLRWFILQKNWRHMEAEAEALDIIRRAFNALGRGIETRPTFEQGQRQTTIAREDCKNCGRALTDDDIAARRHYCGAPCQAAAKLYSAQYFSIMESRTRAAAARMRAASEVPARDCAHCGKNFQPVGADTLYCSHSCSTQAFAEAQGNRLHDQACSECGTMFRPSKRGMQFCSTPCHMKHIQRQTKICAECGSAFHPGHYSSKYCSAACSAENKKRKLRQSRGFDNATRNCGWCTVEFKPTNAASAYCCPSHANEARKQRERERDRNLRAERRAARAGPKP